MGAGAVMTKIFLGRRRREEVRILEENGRREN